MHLQGWGGDFCAEWMVAFSYQSGGFDRHHPKLCQQVCNDPTFFFLYISNWNLFSRSNCVNVIFPMLLGRFQFCYFPGLYLRSSNVSPFCTISRERSVVQLSIIVTFVSQICGIILQFGIWLGCNLNMRYHTSIWHMFRL